MSVIFSLSDFALVPSGILITYHFALVAAVEHYFGGESYCLHVIAKIGVRCLSVQSSFLQLKAA
jgi:hypothetical protein